MWDMFSFFYTLFKDFSEKREEEMEEENEREVKFTVKFSIPDDRDINEFSDKVYEIMSKATIEANKEIYKKDE